jgi:hypothetical protein
MRNLVAAIRSGGIVSTLTRIPMYVEPHTKYNVRRPTQMAIGLAAVRRLTRMFG